MDIRMPDGTLIRDVPDTITAEQLEQLRQQYSVQAPQQAPLMSRIGESITGILPDIGGLSGAAGGAVLGAQLGSILPGAGTIAGGIIGGAIGAFSGAGAGESLRQLVKGESADGLEALAVASREGILDITGAKALDVLSGAGKYALSKLGYSEINVPGKEVLSELQTKLQRRGTTLRASQVDPNSSIIEGIEAAGEASIGGRQGFKAIEAAQKAYIDSEIKAITKVEKSLKGQSLGNLIQNLVDNTRAASSDTFSKVFQKLEEDGAKVTVSLQGVRNMATTWKAEKAKGLTKRVQEAVKKGARIPFTPQSIQGTVDDLLKLSPNTDFSTAFEKLKALKSKLTAMKGDPATKSDPAVRELTQIVKSFEAKLLESADKADPAIGQTYKTLMKEYNQTQSIVYSDVATSLLQEGSPELLGRYLTQAGEVTPIQELKKIIKLAKKQDVDTGGNLMKGIKKGFLEKNLSAASGEGIAKVENFRKKLADPDFARTFDELFDKSDKARLFKLLDEVEILNRGVGGELALSVRSAQVSGATGAAKGQSIISNVIKAITPAKLAEAAANPRRANEMLGLLKRFDYAQKNNLPIPPQALRGMAALLGEMGREMVGQNIEAEREQERQSQLETVRRMQQQ